MHALYWLGNACLKRYLPLNFLYVTQLLFQDWKCKVEQVVVLLCLYEWMFANSEYLFGFILICVIIFLSVKSIIVDAFGA